jgi:hypothetical protein
MKPTDSVVDKMEVSSSTVHSASFIGDNVLENHLKDVKMEYRLACTENSVDNREILNYPGGRKSQVTVWLHCFGTR